MLAEQNSSGSQMVKKTTTAALNWLVISIIGGGIYYFLHLTFGIVNNIIVIVFLLLLTFLSAIKSLDLIYNSTKGRKNIFKKINRENIFEAIIAIPAIILMFFSGLHLWIFGSIGLLFFGRSGSPIFIPAIFAIIMLLPTIIMLVSIVIFIVRCKKRKADFTE